MLNVPTLRQYVQKSFIKPENFNIIQYVTQEN